MLTTIFAPGAGSLAKEFGIASPIIVSLTVSVYLLGFAFGPLFLAPLSEIYGRRIIYHISNAVYLGAVAGCAWSTDVAMFMVFRFASGCASSAPMTIGGGSIADMAKQKKFVTEHALHTSSANPASLSLRSPLNQHPDTLVLRHR